jgi:hypothetical protein
MCHHSRLGFEHPLDGRPNMNIESFENEKFMPYVESHFCLNFRNMCHLSSFVDPSKSIKVRQADTPIESMLYIHVTHSESCLRSIALAFIDPKGIERSSAS